MHDVSATCMIYSKMSKPKPKSRQPPKPSDNPPTLRLERYVFSPQFTSVLHKLTKYDRQEFMQVIGGELHPACQVELARLRELRHQDGVGQAVDNELSVTVMANQITALNDHGADVGSSRRVQTEGGEEGLARHVERVALVIQRSDAQLRRALQGWRTNDSPDLVACYRFFLKQGIRLRHLGHQRLILCRWHLIEAVRFLLGNTIRRFQPQSASLLGQELSSEEEKEFDESQEMNLDELPYSQINGWWRMSSQHIEDKLVELSGICEQIPQLQVFNRNLQFSQLTAPQKHIIQKIAEVLISLHNRIGYLSRRKPQLLKEFEYSLNHITSINTSISTFLSQIESEQAEINPISFQELLGVHSLGEAFGELRRHLVKMGEVIVSQDLYHSENYGRMERMINMVELFVRVVGGEQEFIDEWQELLGLLNEGKDGGLSVEETRLVSLLQECLQLHRTKAQAVFQERQSTSRTNLELEEEVNKLIEDYERLKGQNLQLSDGMDEMSRQRDEMLLDMQEKDSMIANLSEIKVVLEKRLQGMDGQGEQAAKEHYQQKHRLGEDNNKLRQQLKAAEEEKQRLNAALEAEREKYLKTYESMTKLKSEKQRWEIEFEDSKYTIQSLKNDHLRKTNQLNKDITSLNNDKSLLQMQLQSAQKSNIKLLERLEASERKMAEYNRLVMARMDQQQQELVNVDADKLKRQTERYRLRIEGLQAENENLRTENGSLKQKLREIKANHGQSNEQDQLLDELKAKLDKANSKIASLRRQNEELRESQEELRGRQRAENKKIRDLQTREREAVQQAQRLRSQADGRARRGADLQRDLSELRDRLEREVRSNRDNLTRKELELSDKSSQVESLELRLKKLEERLSKKETEAESSAKEVSELKVKQFQTTIQQHKIIQLKMEEQARGLKSELQQKIQVEFKLNLEIERLSKQIDRLKDLLDRHLKELTEKEQLIKFEREKNEQAVKQIREYEARQKVREEQQHKTPNRVVYPKDRLEDTQINDTDSGILSRSEKRYDPHFNSKQYERLSKEYYDFRKSVADKVEKVEAELQKALDEKREAELKAQKMQAECRRLLGGNGEGVEQMRKRLDQMEAGRRRELGQLQGQLEKALKENEQFRRRSGEVQSGLRQEMTKMVQSYEQKIKKMTHEKDRTINDLMVQVRQNKGQSNGDEWKRKYEELNGKVLGLAKERDVMRGQYESTRRQLEDERKKIGNLQSQLSRMRSSQTSSDSVKIDYERVKAELEAMRGELLRQRAQLARERAIRVTVEQQLRTVQASVTTTTISPTQVDLEYYLTRIRVLEEALQAVGCELNDAKLVQVAKGGKRQNIHLSQVSAHTSPQDLNNTLNSSIGNISHSRIQSSIVESRLQNPQIEQLRRQLTRLQGEWNQKQGLYLAKIGQMSQEMASMKESLASKPAEKEKKVTTLSLEGRPLSSTYLEHAPPAPQQGLPQGEANAFLARLDQTLEAGHQWGSARIIELLQQNRVNPNLIKEVDELRWFCLGLLEQTWVLRQQHGKLLESSQMNTANPTLMDNLQEYAFRILTYFSEIEAGSDEAARVRQQLDSLVRNYTGGMFFTVLEEYTIHLLTNNAIERYKRELRVKARELLEIKEKLDELITRQIQQEEQIINRPQPITPRARDPPKYKESPTGK